MSLYIASLNSGSNGNCFYIGNDTEAILVDAGISCRETEKRMKRLELDIKKVKAIFVTHEHSDHITGIPGLSKKHQLPVYITKDTHRDSKIPIEEHLVHSFKGNKAVAVGGLSVTAFKKSHDACDPHSFMISYNTINVGVITDIGYSCKEVIHHFRQCHAVFLETNYCEDMLANGSYPYFLKQRISSDHGHLSNTQALDLFTKHRAPHLTHLILSHLSKNNNSPEVVSRLFARHAAGIQVIVASRYQETAIYNITGKGETISRPSYYSKKNTGQSQLSLF